MKTENDYYEIDWIELVLKMVMAFVAGMVIYVIYGSIVFP